MSKLRELGEVSNGASAPKEYGTFPIYGGNGVLGYCNQTNYPENTIIIGRVGANCGAVSYSREKCWVSDNALAFLVDESSEAYYVYYLLKQLNLNQYHIGSSQPLITQTIINQIECTFIKDQAIQKKISAILEGIDCKVLNNQKIICELEMVAKTIYDYWFLQYDFPDENGRAYKSSGGEMVWNEELKREIPAGWEVSSIGKLFTTNRGVSYNSETLEGEGVPMINLASFTPTGEYKAEGIKNYSGEYTDDKVLKPYDLVMCNTQQTAIDFSKDIIGRALLVPDIFEEDIVSSHHVNTIRTEDEDLKFYLYYLFNTDHFHKYVTGYANGTNILGLVFEGVEKYISEIPEKKVLHEFAELALSIEKKKSEIVRENQELVSLRDFLLPLLMNGQVGFR